MAVSTDDDLAQRALVAGEGDGRDVDEWVGELALLVRDVDALPSFDLLHGLEHFAAATPKGDELDAGNVELGELGIGGELGIEDQSRLDAAADFAPEREELEHLVVGLELSDVCIRVEHQLGLGVLGDHRQGTLHHLVACASPVFLEHRLLTEMRDSVEVEVNNRPP